MAFGDVAMGKIYAIEELTLISCFLTSLLKDFISIDKASAGNSTESNAFVEAVLVKKISVKGVINTIILSE